MSLINEALKRAKRTQPATSAAEGPALRPAETVRQADKGPGLLLPILIGAGLALACFLLWQWFHAGAATQVRARSRSVAEDAAPVLIPSAPAPAAALPKAPAVATVPVAGQESPEKISSTNVAASGELVDTNAVAVVEAKPLPPTYKLQSIF